MHCDTHLCYVTKKFYAVTPFNPIARRPPLTIGLNTYATPSFNFVISIITRKFFYGKSSSRILQESAVFPVVS